MTTVAYIANQFPSAIEPYVMDEIDELRSRGVGVVCCSGKRVPAALAEQRTRAFCDETRFFQPLSDTQLVRAARRLVRHRHIYSSLLRPVLRDWRAAPVRRVRSLGHTLLGAALAEELEVLGVEHIHAHHGYFASWMALVAAELLGISFSFTLHGSDLFLRADLLSAKLRACRFCVTVSEFNRDYILRTFPSTPRSKVMVQRLGVDPVEGVNVSTPKPRPSRFCLLSAGRLHAVKNHEFLIHACAMLRDQGLDFLCWIAGEGPERRALELLIHDLDLGDRVLLLGHVKRTDLSGYYRYADLFVLTSRSEGLPVALMEAMAHGRLVLAPAITGIPELVEHERNGFLYQAGSLPDFVRTVKEISARPGSLDAVGRAAVEAVARGYDRGRNLRRFADQFLERIARTESEHASSLLQQVQLPV
jgi:glycosyltransferase involved in cell wall biosynthesis